MGNIFGTRTMAEEFRRNQEFITEMNKIKTERHIQMQNQMREREMALKIAKDRELVLWLGAFYFVSVPYLYMAWRNTGKSKYLGPVIPLSFFLAYQIDKGYGNKLDRIRQEAEMIMQFEPEMLDLPCGLPTASSIDQARLNADERKKLHPALPVFEPPLTSVVSSGVFGKPTQLFHVSITVEDDGKHPLSQSCETKQVK